MKCPGQDTQYWKPGAIYEVTCPQCGGVVEFFKDDTARKCGHCGHRFVNPKMDFGCAAYCQYAAECLGTLPAEVIAGREELLKDRVAVEMKRFYRSDFKKIGQASRTARYAEAIAKEAGGNIARVLMAAYLRGMRDADAQSILEKLGAPPPLIQGVLSLTAADDAAPVASELDAKILADAYRITLLEERHKVSPLSPQEIELETENGFHTANAVKIARKALSA